MSDPIDTLVVDVRANTRAFAQDVAQMQASFDRTVGNGLAQAGPLLERGLVSAIRKGSLGFEDLRRVALEAIDAIAAQAAQGLLGGAANGGSGVGGGGLLPLAASLISGALGLPGRATGGPVGPGRSYLVGERGPELFVPTSAGRVEPSATAGPAREVRVAISIQAPPGTSAPQALQLSSRQVASAVRRALRDA